MNLIMFQSQNIGRPFPWAPVALWGAASLALSSAGFSQEPPSDKSQYHILRPTPRALMREIAADRPDITETPHTVDAGHFQMETHALAYTRKHTRNPQTDEIDEGWEFGAVNLKAGLLNNMDVELFVPRYTKERSRDRLAGETTRRSGFGDITPRLKINLWGNDGGTTAFAVMPYVKLPTGGKTLGNGAVEGGLVLPLEVELPSDWGLGLMGQYDWNRNGTGNGYHAEFTHTIMLEHALGKRMRGFVEFYSLASLDRGSSWVGMVGGGLAWSVNDNLMLDAGVHCGVTRAADDVRPFIGFTWRY